MTSFKPAFEVKPNDMILRKRPNFLGGGFAPDRVRKIGINADHPHMVVIAGQGWRWSVPIRYAVELV